MNRKEEFLNSIIVFDTETTDKDFKKAEVIEFGHTIRQNGKWISTTELYKPSLPISPEVSAINNITNKMVIDKISFTDAINETMNMLSRYDGIVAHNMFYDNNVLKNYNVDTFEDKHICTFRLSKHLYGNDPSVTQFNLQYLRYRFDIEIDQNNAHRADFDSLLCALYLEHIVDECVSRKLIDDSTDYASQLSELSKQPYRVYTMPFGKHAGQPLESVPLSYWDWALANIPSLQEDAPEYDYDFASSVINAIESQL